MANYASREEMLEAYGSFAIAFEPIGAVDCPYLCLPNLLDETESRTVTDAIHRATNSVDAETHAITLLRDVNWRPHLVGAVAACWLRSNAVICELWRALDAGSWVTPQLAAALSRIDKEFLQASAERLQAGCPLSRDPEYTLDSSIERHSAQGPSGSRARSAKAAAALVSLLETHHSDQESILVLRRNKSLQELLTSDIDDSGAIAVEWRRDLDKLIHNQTDS